MTDHWIPTPSGKIFARSWAPAVVSGFSVVVLLHDSLGCVELWREFPERLAAATNRRVIAYDRLGFGRSDPRGGPLPLTFTRDEAADVVPHLREALDVDRMIPFGHSVGGSMAIATAARFPDACDAVITEAAQAFVEDRTLAGIRAAHATFEEPEQFARLERYHGDKARWVLESWYATWMSPDFADWSYDDDLRRVHCPTLAIHGDRDEYGSVDHPKRIVRLVPGPSRALILDDCGHVPHREQQERVLEEIETFLAG